MQMFGVEQVVHADAHAINLVGICGADATAGGADLMLAEEAFGHLVQHAMVRSDDMRAFAHQQPGAVHATALQTIDFFEQHFRIHDHAIADDRGRGRADDAGRQQVQRIRFVADHHGMARVVAAVEAGDVVDLRADQICCLAFALVSPLGTDQNNSRHVVAPPCVRNSALSLAPKALQRLLFTLYRVWGMLTAPDRP